MSDKKIWRGIVIDGEGEEVCRAEHEVSFEKNAFSEFMDLLDYAYFASAEKPLLTMPKDHEIKIRVV